MDGRQTEAFHFHFRFPLPQSVRERVLLLLARWRSSYPDRIIDEIIGWLHEDRPAFRNRAGTMRGGCRDVLHETHGGLSSLLACECR